MVLALRTKTTGLVLNSAMNRSPVAPTNLRDRSRWRNHGTFGAGAAAPTPVRLPSGLWVFSFDSIDDIITIPDAPSIQNIFDPPGATVWFWIRAKSVGENLHGRIWNKTNHEGKTDTDSGSGTCKFSFRQFFSTTAGLWQTTNYVITFLKPVMISVSYNNGSVANDPVITVDGNPVAITEIITPVGTRTTDVASPLYIGNEVGTTNTFDGYIMSFLAVKGRILTPGQILQRFGAKRDWYGV